MTQNKTISSGASTVKGSSKFLVAEACSLCVPATSSSTASTQRLITLLKGGTLQTGHQGHCQGDSALSSTSKAGTKAETW